MGGMHGFGAVRTPDGHLTAHEPWEVRAQAVALFSGAARRSSIEALDPATYLASSYYVRWMRAAETTLVRTGQLERSDIDRWQARFTTDPDSPRPTREDPAAAEFFRRLGPHHHSPVASAAFAVGDHVRVRRMRPEAHHRCPRYLRGAIGEVEKVCGADPVPGEDPSVLEPVYTVRFDSTDLFGDRTADGEPAYELYIDLWERYVEKP